MQQRTSDASAGLSGRFLEPEIMDDPALDPGRHRAALKGLARINRLSFAIRPLGRAIGDLLRPPEALRLLDVGIGGGDVAVGLAVHARRRGVSMTVTGIDRSELALEVAAARAAEASVELDRVCADALVARLPGGHDVVLSSLFLHHLDRGAAVDLLRRMAGVARRRVLVQDLRRCALGSALAAIVPRLLTRSPVVHVDARRSARAAFSAGELSAIARDAGLASARLRRHFPARMTLVSDPTP